jgi:hydroxypyruvate isomerase
VKAGGESPGLVPPRTGRRAVLAAPFAAALAAGRPTAPKLSVRVEPVFPGLGLPAQLERVAAAGYQGFEFGDWRAQDAGRINAVRKPLGIECVCLVGNRGVNPKGMGLCDPAERPGFLAEIAASLDAARRFETRMLVVLTGYKVPRLSRERQQASIVEGLKRGAELAARAGVTLIVEPINTRATIEPLHPTGGNHANYFLDTTAEAVEIIRRVDSPFVRILYDLYHAQIMEGNLTETIRRHIGLFAHIHVADVPGRHEPGTGEINFSHVFRAIAGTGYAGYLGMEYVPQSGAMESLAAAKALAAQAYR